MLSIIRIDPNSLTLLVDLNSPSVAILDGGHFLELIALLMSTCAAGGIAATRSVSL